MKVLEEISDGVIVKDRPDPDPEKPRPMHDFFWGIENCASMIREEENRRGYPFSFSIRLRFDISFDYSARSVGTWPIWNDSARAPVLMFSGYSSNVRKFNPRKDKLYAVECGFTDVFFIYRYEPTLSNSSSYLFEDYYGTHHIARSHPGYISYNPWPATLYWPLLRRGIPYFSLSHRNRCLFSLSHGCYERPTQRPRYSTEP